MIISFWLINISNLRNKRSNNSRMITCMNSKMMSDYRITFKNYFSVRSRKDGVSPHTNLIIKIYILIIPRKRWS